MQRRVNLLVDSTTDGLKVSPKIFLKFAFYFFQKQHFTRDYVLRDSKIGEDAYKSLLSLVRKKITEFVENNRRQFGGILKEIQIYETYWAKRKYNVKDLVKRIWI
ncbi:hypothetical protein DMUE_4335 [Dictyocoela muelleri]|nr:hypothetical protein DMUE_4335 [Dictyocoela muelleri]